MKTSRIRIGKIIEFTYKNYKGETKRRKVISRGFLYGSTEFYQEEQMLFEGLDLDKNDKRIFAVKNMSDVTVHNY